MADLEAWLAQQQKKVQALSGEQLEALEATLAEFSKMNDLENWLESQATENERFETI